MHAPRSVAHPLVSYFRHSARLGPVVLAVVAALTLVSCGDPREQMQRDLDTFPLPEHLDLVESDTEGPTHCFGSAGPDCPGAVRHFVSTRSVEESCEDIQDAVAQWGVEDARWHLGDSELNPCLMSGNRGEDELTLSVFDASRYIPGLTATIDPSEVERYSAAVTISLKRDRILAGDIALGGLLVSVVIAPVGIVM